MVSAFVARKPHPTQKDILEFHQSKGDADPANDLLMERGNICSTLSITSILIAPDRGNMKYLDLKNNTVHEKKIKFRHPFEVI